MQIRGRAVVGAMFGVAAIFAAFYLAVLYTALPKAAELEAKLRGQVACRVGTREISALEVFLKRELLRIEREVPPSEVEALLVRIEEVLQEEMVGPLSAGELEAVDRGLDTTYSGRKRKKRVRSHAGMLDALILRPDVAAARIAHGKVPERPPMDGSTQLQEVTYSQHVLSEWVKAVGVKGISDGLKIALRRDFPDHPVSRVVNP